MKQTESKFSYAFIKSLPVMAGYLFLGIAYGIVLEEAGFGAGWALLMSTCIFAGSLQFVMVPLLAAAVSPWTMLVTALFINSRHIFYGLSFVDAFKKIRAKLYMIFALSDETYSILCECKTADPEEKHLDSWPILALLDQSYWIIGSVVGALLGRALSFDFTGIDFSMTALFTVILIEQILQDKKRAGVAAVAGIAVSLIGLKILGTDHFLLPSLIVTVLIVAGLTGFSGFRNKAQGEGDKA